MAVVKLVTLPLLLVVSYVSPSNAKVFMGGVNRTNQADVETSLAEALAGHIAKERLEPVEAALSTMYATLPKNSDGRLGHQAVRYVLHHFFQKRRGWLVKGLEPTSDPFYTASEPGALVPSGWVPTLLQDRLEEHMGNHGIALHELAALAVVIEDIIYKEAAKSLHSVYEVLGFSKDKPMTVEEAENLAETYLMVLLKRNLTLDDPTHAADTLRLFKDRYRGWGIASTWLSKLMANHYSTHPADANGVDLASMELLVHEVVDNFGSGFLGHECLAMKKHLNAIEGPSRKAGRVRLPDFYNQSRDSLWRFSEKKDYLRSLGALDESNASQPLVIVSNYILSYPNCLKATSVINLFSMCCRNECEDLMGSLEQEVAAPTASSEKILEVIGSLSSDTIVAPRELPDSLAQRLQEIALAHGGNVQLHSRLFSQWMHHAFPRECPYPHEAGAINPQDADDWMKATGQKSEIATDQEMQKIVDDACPITEHDQVELPWTHVDEVLGGQGPVPVTRPWFTVFGLTAVLWVMLLLWRFGPKGIRGDQKHIFFKVCGVCLITVAAFGCGFIDGTTFALELVVIIVVLVARQLMPNVNKDKGGEKDFV